MNTKINDLIIELDKAEKIVSNFSGGYSNRFLSAEEFHLALKDRIEKLKSNRKYVIDELMIWFSPTCSWDDFIGIEGLELGENIFSKLETLSSYLNIIEIDLEKINSIDELHSIFQKELEFPNFYGKNWDAFWDSITGIAEMPDILKLINWSDFETKFKSDSKILDDIIVEFNNSELNHIIKKT